MNIELSIPEIQDAPLLRSITALLTGLASHIVTATGLSDDRALELSESVAAHAAVMRLSHALPFLVKELSEHLSPFNPLTAEGFILIPLYQPLTTGQAEELERVIKDLAVQLTPMVASDSGGTLAIQIMELGKSEETDQ